MRTAVAGILLGALVLGGIIFTSQRMMPAKPKTVYTLVATPWGCEKLFGLQAVSQVVHSEYLYESPLLGTTAVDDIDCLLPYAAQELVTLPGFKSDYYNLRFIQYIPGSGIASCWQIRSNYGNFCLLHLSISNVNLVRGTNNPLFPENPLWTKGRKLSGDELTALAVMSERPAGPALPSISRYHGGFAVGRSGWPTDPLYGNGIAGPANAHLCIVLDQTAANWFLSILDGSHKPPKPPVFPWKRWNGWRSNHHEKPIAAHKKNGKLIPIAKAWWGKSLKYRGVVSKKYFPVTRRRKHAFLYWRFRCGKGWVWAKSLKMQRTRCLR